VFDLQFLFDIFSDGRSEFRLESDTYFPIHFRHSAALITLYSDNQILWAQWLPNGSMKVSVNFTTAALDLPGVLRGYCQHQ